MITGGLPHLVGYVHMPMATSEYLLHPLSQYVTLTPTSHKMNFYCFAVDPKWTGWTWLSPDSCMSMQWLCTLTTSTLITPFSDKNGLTGCEEWTEGSRRAAEILKMQVRDNFKQQTNKKKASRGKTRIAQQWPSETCFFHLLFFPCSNISRMWLEVLDLGPVIQCESLDGGEVLRSSVDMDSLRLPIGQWTPDYVAVYICWKKLFGMVSLANVPVLHEQNLKAWWSGEPDVMIWPIRGSHRSPTKEDINLLRLG